MKNQVKSILGNIPTPQSAVQKFETEFVPSENLFGINDKHERRELVELMKEAGARRVCFVCPNDEKLLKGTLDMAHGFLEKDFLVGFAGINNVNKMHTLKKIVGESGLQKFAYFNNNTPVSEVEHYCAKRKLGFLPSANNKFEIKEFSSKYRVVKIDPFVELKEEVRGQGGFEGTLFGGGRGVKPVIINEKTNTPIAPDWAFAEWFGLEQIVSLTGTQPTKAFLDKTKEKQPMEKMAKYFEFVKEL